MDRGFALLYLHPFVCKKKRQKSENRIASNLQNFYQKLFLQAIGNFHLIKDRSWNPLIFNISQ